MSFREEINEISHTVRGKFISSIPLKYDDEINDLIANPGSQEFILKASLEAKAEFLAYADSKNFQELVYLFNEEDFLPISDAATIDQLRAILNKLLISDKSQKKFFSNRCLEGIRNIDEEKCLLIKGFLKRMSLNKDDDLTDEDIDDFKNEFNRIRIENDYLKSNHNKIVDELKSKIYLLEEENAKEIQQRINDNLSGYVDDSVGKLNDIEKKLKCAAARWSLLSIIVLFSGFSAGIGFSLFGYAFGPDLKDLNWPELLIFSIKGIFIVSAFLQRLVTPL